MRASSPLVRVGIVVAGAAVALVLFLLLRPEEDGPAAGTAATPTATASPEAGPATTAGTGTTATTGAETETEPVPATTPTEPEPGPTTVRILVQGDEVEGGVQRVRVERGERVRLVVRSDVADHVHLHGYDVMRNVGPGRPAQLVFDATVPGRFEVELEDRRLPVATIEVRP